MVMVTGNTQTRQIDSSTAETLRRAFIDSGLSIKRWSVQAGTPYATTHAIACGSRDVLTATADKLAGALGMKLVLEPVRRERRA